MNQAVLPITGYLDRFSARPGEDVVARISLGTVGPYRVPTGACDLWRPEPGRARDAVRGPVRSPRPHPPRPASANPSRFLWIGPQRPRAKLHGFMHLDRAGLDRPFRWRCHSLLRRTLAHRQRQRRRVRRTGGLKRTRADKHRRAAPASTMAPRLAVSRPKHWSARNWTTSGGLARHRSGE